MTIRACRVDRKGVEDRSRGGRPVNCSCCFHVTYATQRACRGAGIFFSSEIVTRRAFSLKILARYSSEIGVCQFVRRHCRQYCSHVSERRWSDSTFLPPHKHPAFTSHCTRGVCTWGLAMCCVIRIEDQTNGCIVRGLTRGMSKTFLHNVEPTLGPTRPPIQWIPEIKRPERDVDHSPDLSMYAFMARKGTVLTYSSDKVEKNGMGGACSAYVGEERRMQGFGEET